MVVKAPALEEQNVDFDREDLDMVYPEDGDLLTTKGPRGQDVICGRCENKIAKEFEWASVSNIHTVCPECDATLLLGGLR